jgi:hypothetical protein
MTYSIAATTVSGASADLPDFPRARASNRTVRYFPSRRRMTRLQFCTVPKPTLRKSRAGVPPEASTGRAVCLRQES